MNLMGKNLLKYAIKTRLIWSW